MDFLIDNWFLIICSACVGVVLGILIVNFIKMPTSEKLIKIRAWLLSAVIWAEQEYGEGTGKIKLSAVYGEFCRYMPWVAKVISFNKFSALVDEALVEMRKILTASKEGEENA